MDTQRMCPDAIALKAVVDLANRILPTEFTSDDAIISLNDDGSWCAFLGSDIWGSGWTIPVAIANLCSEVEVRATKV